MPDLSHNADALLATDLHVQATYRLTEALIEAENRMRRRVELLSEIVFETDPEGKLVFLNRAWNEVLHWEADACLGQPLLEHVWPDDRAHLDALMSDRSPAVRSQRLQVRVQRRDGQLAWLEISVARLPTGGVVGAAHDVTRQKAVQDELARLSLVASSTDSLVIITDREGRTEWVNQALVKRTGYTLAEMAGRKPGEVLQGPETDPQTVARIREGLRAGRSLREELLNYTKTGEPYWVSIQISPVFGDSGEVERYVAVQADVTELRRTQAELEAARQRAEVANRAKSEFLATMSHEIRTPMNGVLGMAELLLQSRLDPRQRELAEHIVGSGRALLTIINDILDLAKIEAGRVALVDEEFELRALVEGVVALVAQSVRGKPVVVQAERAPGGSGRFRGDPGRLRQILLNLVGNGLKFTVAGSVVTRVHQAPTGNEQVRLRFEVADTGIGIPAEKLPLLFQPFQQVDSSSTRRYGGTGLGLAISKRLVEMMGGQMGVQSEPGRGSTFWFEVTLSAIPQAAAQDVVADDDVVGDLRVLVVQDNPIQRRLTALTLEKLGCRPVVVGAGREVWAHLAAEPIDVILLDRHLADVDGLTLARAVRDRDQSEAKSSRRPVRLIMANADDGPIDLDRMIAAGVEITLKSPLTLAALKRALLPSRARAGSL